MNINRLLLIASLAIAMPFVGLADDKAPKKAVAAAKDAKEAPKAAAAASQP